MKKTRSQNRIRILSLEMFKVPMLYNLGYSSHTNILEININHPRKESSEIRILKILKIKTSFQVEVL